MMESLMTRWRWAPLALASTLLAAGFKAEEQAKFLAAGEGQMLVAKRCANCHTAGTFTKVRKSEQAWEDVMADMANRGAEIPEDDYDPIVAYLAKNYGPSAKLHVNRAPVEEIGKLLALSKEQAKAVVAYRDANGAFRTFEDFAKVPGLDVSKIEAKRDLLAFTTQ